MLLKEWSRGYLTTMFVDGLFSVYFYRTYLFLGGWSSLMAMTVMLMSELILFSFESHFNNRTTYARVLVGCLD